MLEALGQAWEEVQLSRERHARGARTAQPKGREGEPLPVQAEPGGLLQCSGYSVLTCLLLDG